MNGWWSLAGLVLCLLPAIAFLIGYVVGRNERQSIVGITESTTTSFNWERNGDRRKGKDRRSSLHVIEVS